MGHQKNLHDLIGALLDNWEAGADQRRQKNHEKFSQMPAGKAAMSVLLRLFAVVAFIVVFSFMFYEHQESLINNTMEPPAFAWVFGNN